MISSQKPDFDEGGFRVGDRVAFVYGVKRLKGLIVEDRGKVGVGGRQLFLVEAPLKYDRPMQLELPEDELERLPNAAT
jgi:hypothetical protein